MMKEKRIIVENLSKKFRIGAKKNRNALAQLVSFFSKNTEKDFWALKNISFSVKNGENIGIIGKNGSGKTTLLRTIAGIYEPDKAGIKVKGNLVYLSNLSNGLKPKLTVRDNIFLLGSITGLGQKDIKKKFNEIVDFAGLENFVYSKIHQLSSGMIQRLAFSISIYSLKHSNPDIILLDEPFSEGNDEEFSRKALNEIEELTKYERTAILVSHKIDLIKNCCNKAIWLDKGKIVKQGKADKVIEKYLKLTNKII